MDCCYGLLWFWFIYSILLVIFLLIIYYGVVGWLCMLLMFRFLCWFRVK